MTTHYVLEYVFDPGYFVQVKDNFPRKTDNPNLVTYWLEVQHCKKYFEMQEIAFKKNPVEIKKINFISEDI